MGSIYNSKTKSLGKIVAPLNKKLESVEWGEYELRRLFNINPTKWYHLQNEEIISEDGIVPLVSTFNDYILEPIHKSFNKLPDGNYNLKITNIVIGAKGGLVYYNMDSLDNDLKTLPSDYKIWITEKIKKMLDKFPEMTPAWLNDEHVPCLFYEWWDKRIIVKDHIAKFDE